MKKNLLALLSTSLITCSIIAQTNVSGGIYSNTTWTKAKSPYIVTDTVVVFPGVTLTIQPGVTVKFDSNVQLELRQAALIAIGTNTDSITFTSNASLIPGSWNEIYIHGGNMTSKFNYCNFRYATAGLYDGRSGVNDTLIIKNSNFNFNGTGISGQGTGYGIIDTSNFRHNSTGVNIYGTTFNYCDLSYNQTGLYVSNGYDKVNNCTINHNQTGIGSMRNSTANNCIINRNQSGIISVKGAKVKNTIVDSNTVVGIQMGSEVDSIYNCQMKYNGIGLSNANNGGSWPNTVIKNTIENNSIGTELAGGRAYNGDIIYCNKICNNTSYDLKYTGSSNYTLANNYWCTSDSTSIEATIYDGYDDINLGLVKFMPIDSTCYLGLATGVPVYKTQTFSFSIFPNPASDNLTVELPTNISKTQIKIFNMLGELEYSSMAAKKRTDVDVSSLASGIYIIQIATDNNNISRQKFIRQ